MDYPHMGNEFDEKFNQLMMKNDVKSELFQRYADDIDLVIRSVGRTRRFCPQTARMYAAVPPSRL